MRYIILTKWDGNDRWNTQPGGETNDITEAFRSVQWIRTEFPESKAMLVDTVAGMVLADATYEAAAV